MQNKLILLVLVFFTLNVFGQTKREVYITLDVSGSMNNDKYILANYTAQLISTLCQDDDVYLIIFGHSQRISGNEVYKKIQIRYNELGLKWKVASQESQIEDIKKFNNIFKEKNDVDQWLFIIGDGIWGTPSHPFITNTFKKIVDKGKIHVCYLQTGTDATEFNDFTGFLEKLKIVDIQKSSIDPSTIIENCNVFTTTILGLSKSSLPIKPLANQCVTTVSVLPSLKYIVLYQDEIKDNQLPKLTSVVQNGKSMTFSHKGNPSNSMLLSPVASKLLSGSVWFIEPGFTIQANIPVTLCFDRNFNTKNLKVYPLVDVKIAQGGIQIVSGQAKMVDETTMSICKDNENAIVRIRLNDNKGGSLPEAILKDTKVEFISNNKSYRASYKNGGFECTLPLTDETTLYYSKSECPGYFTRISKINKIILTDDCEPETPSVLKDSTLAEQYLGSMMFNQMMRGDCMDALITDESTLEILDPSKFNISVKHNYPILFKRVEISITGNKVQLCFEPRGDWCDCFFPDTLKLQAKISPKPGADFGGKTYANRIIPLKVFIARESWFTRCKSIIFSMASALLVFLYLFYLIRKPRFKRGSVIINEYSDYYIKDPEWRVALRKKGLSNWLNRWINPFVSEKRTISYTQINKTFTFIATGTKYRIKFHSSAYDKKLMNYSDYDEESKESYIQFGSGNTITIKKNIAEEGKMKITYDHRDSIPDDIPTFRLFLVLLMFALVIFFCTSGFLLLKSFLSI